MNKTDHTQKLLDEYEKKRFHYDMAARAVKAECQAIAERSGLLSGTLFSCRSKSPDSLKQKLHKYRASQPPIPVDALADVPDLAGVRVVLDSEVQASAFTAAFFTTFSTCDPDYSSAARPAVTDLGYRSRHVSLLLPEQTDHRNHPHLSNDIAGLRCEIQIRTLLEHAWAQTQRNFHIYKTSEPPRTLQRRLNLLAGVLEQADHEVASVAAELAQYSSDIERLHDSLRNTDDAYNLLLSSTAKQLADRAFLQSHNNTKSPCCQSAQSLFQVLSTVNMTATRTILNATFDSRVLLPHILSWTQPIKLPSLASAILLSLACTSDDWFTQEELINAAVDVNLLPSGIGAEFLRRLRLVKTGARKQFLARN